MPISTKTKVAGIAGLASSAWLMLAAAIAANQRKLVFNPSVAREAIRPKSLGHHTRTVVLRAKDGTRLEGWLLTPDSPGPHPAVLYFGGRSEEVSWVPRDAGAMFPGHIVLVVNYRGYGLSQGVPTEKNLVSDAVMLFDWLASQPNVVKDSIAIVGRSLGSGVAIQVAKARAVRALILITPYDSILAIAKKRFKAFPVSVILQHKFESLKHAAELTVPTYVLRAAADAVVPFANTDRLVGCFKNLREDLSIPDSNHNSIPYLEKTQENIARILAA